ncbi:hypothetical protein COO60DRAFT_1624958 [Scenedesmus sp. NREL 46B-D3]|nr:hypothetical protein COO60DRAFT_1624958 [Scenedesmus sp. NREL 46B-D3]
MCVCIRLCEDTPPGVMVEVSGACGMRSTSDAAAAAAAAGQHGQRLLQRPQPRSCRIPQGQGSHAQQPVTGPAEAAAQQRGSTAGTTHACRGGTRSNSPNVTHMRWLAKLEDENPNNQRGDIKRVHSRSRKRQGGEVQGLRGGCAVKHAVLGPADCSRCLPAGLERNRHAALQMSRMEASKAGCLHLHNRTQEQGQQLESTSMSSTAGQPTAAAMASSFAATEKFRVTMQDNDGSSQRVTVQLSLDGLKILNQDGSRTMRSYNLRNVARWDLMDTSTVIWTKADVDLEERALTLSSDPTTVRNVVDTLAMCCMQLAEIIQEKDRAAASNLEELASGNGKTKKAQKLPSVDAVEYWRAPDKAGWLQSQSEVMKMWRRRWFVLKQGYLFRFLSPDVSESVKPRGVVDLSKVQDVRDGRGVTGKANTVQLKTASGGSVCYVCESGVDDSEAAPGSSSRERHRSSSGRDRHVGGGSSNSSAAEWAKQVERSLSQGAGGSSRRGNGSSGMNGSAMVSVVNYAGGSGSGSGSGANRSSAPPAAAMYDPYSGGGGGGDYGGISSYSQISGCVRLAGPARQLLLLVRRTQQLDAGVKRNETNNKIDVSATRSRAGPLLSGVGAALKAVLWLCALAFCALVLHTAVARCATIHDTYIMAQQQRQRTCCRCGQDNFCSRLAASFIASRVWRWEVCQVAQGAAVTSLMQQMVEAVDAGASVGLALAEELLAEAMEPSAGVGPELAEEQLTEAVDAGACVGPELVEEQGREEAMQETKQQVKGRLQACLTATDAMQAELGEESSREQLEALEVPNSDLAAQAQQAPGAGAAAQAGIEQLIARLAASATEVKKELLGCTATMAKGMQQLHYAHVEHLDHDRAAEAAASHQPSPAGAACSGCSRRQAVVSPSSRRRGMQQSRLRHASSTAVAGDSSAGLACLQPHPRPAAPSMLAEHDRRQYSARQWQRLATGQPPVAVRGRPGQASPHSAAPSPPAMVEALAIRRDWQQGSRSLLGLGWLGFGRPSKTPGSVTHAVAAVRVGQVAAAQLTGQLQLQLQTLQLRSLWRLRQLSRRGSRLQQRAQQHLPAAVGVSLAGGTAAPAAVARRKRGRGTSFAGIGVAAAAAGDWEAVAQLARGSRSASLRARGPGAAAAAASSEAAVHATAGVARAQPARCGRSGRASAAVAGWAAAADTAEQQEAAARPGMSDVGEMAGGGPEQAGRGAAEATDGAAADKWHEKRRVAAGSIGSKRERSAAGHDAEEEEEENQDADHAAAAAAGGSKPARQHRSWLGSLFGRLIDGAAVEGGPEAQQQQRVVTQGTESSPSVTQQVVALRLTLEPRMMLLALQAQAGAGARAGGGAWDVRAAGRILLQGAGSAGPGSSGSGFNSGGSGISGTGTGNVQRGSGGTTMDMTAAADTGTDTNGCPESSLDVDGGTLQLRLRQRCWHIYYQRPTQTNSDIGGAARGSTETGKRLA